MSIFSRFFSLIYIYIDVMRFVILGFSVKSNSGVKKATKGMVTLVQKDLIEVQFHEQCRCSTSF